MQTELNRSKHDIFVGNQIGQKLEGKFNIGYALKYENAKYYILKLWPYPNVTYFLSANRDSHDKFTIFTKKIENENTVQFQNPVGYAILRSELKEYLEINLRLPKQRLYMSVYPTQN